MNLMLVSGASSRSGHILCRHVVSSLVLVLVLGLGLFGLKVGFWNVVELIMRNLKGRILECR